MITNAPAAVIINTIRTAIGIASPVLGEVLADSVAVAVVASDVLAATVVVASDVLAATVVASLSTFVSLYTRN